MANETVQSYQQQYPVMPDVSLQAYYKAMGHHTMFSKSGIGRWWHSTFGGDQSYNQWRSNLLDRHSADLNAYNSYITSLAGQKAMAEEAGYNPAWLDSSAGGGTSPLEYQNAPDPADQIPDALGTFLGSIRNTLGLMLGAKELVGKSLQNDILRQNVRIRTAEADAAQKYFGSRASRLAFLSDWQNLMNDTELQSRYGDLGDQVIHYGENDYVLDRGTKSGLMYQKQDSEIEYRKASKDLVVAQKRLSTLNAKEREYYVDNIQPLIKEYTEGRKTYQETVNAFYEEQKNNEMNNRTANTVAKIFFGLLNVASRIFLGTTIVDVDALSGEVVGERTSKPTLAKP